MKLVWSPETAFKAYMDTVKSCEIFQDSSVAELVSAMAAGWNAKLVVETWSYGGPIATSVGLAVATHHTRGRHICIVPNEETKKKYLEALMRQYDQTAPEIIVGEAEEAMKGLEGIDFLVVDCRGNNDFSRIIRVAKLGQRGAVLVCKNASLRAGSTFKWRNVLDGGSRIVRSVFLPVGKGLDVAYVGANGGGEKGASRWIKYVDFQSGEEFVIRK